MLCPFVQPNIGILWYGISNIVMHFICPTNKVKEVEYSIGISIKVRFKLQTVCYLWFNLTDIISFSKAPKDLNGFGYCKKKKIKKKSEYSHNSCKFDWCVEKCRVNHCWHYGDGILQMIIWFFFYEKKSLTLIRSPSFDVLRPLFEKD